MLIAAKPVWFLHKEIHAIYNRTTAQSNLLCHFILRKVSFFKNKKESSPQMSPGGDSALRTMKFHVTQILHEYCYEVKSIS